jgi:thioredoxin-related protein
MPFCSVLFYEVKIFSDINEYFKPDFEFYNIGIQEDGYPLPHR